MKPLYKGGKAKNTAEKGSGNPGHSMPVPWPLPAGFLQVYLTITPFYWVFYLKWNFMFLAVGSIITEPGPAIVMTNLFTLLVGYKTDNSI